MKNPDTNKLYTEYSAKYIIIETEVDDFEKGCLPDTREIKHEERIDITAISLKELINKLAEKYYLDIDSVHLSDSYISFSQTEDKEGTAAIKPQIDEWKKGNLNLWLTDYVFCVEKSFVQIELDLEKELA